MDVLAFTCLSNEYELLSAWAHLILELLNSSLHGFKGFVCSLEFCFSTK